MPVKKLSALLIGINSKNKSDFDCLNCLCSFGTNRIWKENRNEALFIIYADLECLIDIKVILKIYPQAGEYIPSGFSMSTLL